MTWTDALILLVIFTGGGAVCYFASYAMGLSLARQRTEIAKEQAALESYRRQRDV